MKKYKKPEIKIEKFELSESVAACDSSEGWIFRGNQDKNSCYLETSWDDHEGLNPFSSNACNYVETEETCYMIFSSDSAILYGSV